MAFLRVLTLGLFLLWLVVDNAIVFGRRRQATSRDSRVSLVVILIAKWIGVGAAITFGMLGLGGFGALAVPAQIAGLVVFFAGVAIRSTAIAQLGRFHTPDVAVQPGQRVVEVGLYRHVRPPSYLGGLLALFGFGLGLGSWLGALVLLGVALAAYLHRIGAEERALLDALGAEYGEYCKRTRRLIPGIY